MNGSDRTGDVLVVSGLCGWMDGTLRSEKLHTHVVPLRDAADGVTVLSIGTFPGDIPGLDARSIPPSSSRFVDFARLALAAIRCARSGRYDLVASFSLVPYGLIALLAGRVGGVPAHLGIIGMDLDVHATGPFGPIVRALFRRFDAISVAGSTCGDRLERMGVDPARIHTILHPVPLAYADASRAEPEYDLLWVGRMSPEKRPDRFLDIVERLRASGSPVTAAMVGDGPAMAEMTERVEGAGLADVVELVGWCDAPIAYYRRSRLYVLTSEREMLPLTLVEAMLTGTPPVTPPLGAVPDLVSDDETGYIVDDRDPGTYARTIRQALSDDATRRRIGRRAREVESVVHPAAVADAWRDLLAAVGGDVRRRDPGPTERTA